MVAGDVRGAIRVGVRANHVEGTTHRLVPVRRLGGTQFGADRAPNELRD